MENASKALIIAGAILISILIIGLGVVVYNNVSKTIRGANLNTEEAMAQNNKFNQYFGTKVAAPDVKALLNAISANNATANAAEEKTKTIFVKFQPKTGSVSYGVSGTLEKIKGGTTYTVNTNGDVYKDELTPADDSAKYTGYYTSGYIKTILIKEN